MFGIVQALASNLVGKMLLATFGGQVLIVAMRLARR